MEFYSIHEAARFFKVSPARLRYWQRTDLVSATPRELEGQRPFDFRDLVGIKSVVSLLGQGVPLRRIRSSVESIRRRLPEVGEPLRDLRTWTEGSERVVVRHEGGLFEPDGQMVFDLAPCAAHGSAVAPLQNRRADAPPPRREQALAWFERGCSLDSDPRTYGDARQAYLAATEADPEFADAFCNLGAVHYNQGQRESAREAYLRALALDPGHFEGNLNLANLLEEEEENEAALRHYKAAMSVDPLYADVQLQLALVFEKLALPRKAREHWRRYLQLAPSGNWATVARQRLARPS